jgi:hypothetical protein
MDISQVSSSRDDILYSVNGILALTLFFTCIATLITLPKQ